MLRIAVLLMLSLGAIAVGHFTLGRDRPLNAQQMEIFRRKIIVISVGEEFKDEFPDYRLLPTDSLLPTKYFRPTDSIIAVRWYYPWQQAGDSTPKIADALADYFARELTKQGYIVGFDKVTNINNMSLGSKNREYRRAAWIRIVKAEWQGWEKRFLHIFHKEK